MELPCIPAAPMQGQQFLCCYSPLRISYRGVSVQRPSTRYQNAKIQARQNDVERITSRLCDNTNRYNGKLSVTVCSLKLSLELHCTF
jgi:hypothetical protein